MSDFPADVSDSTLFARASIEPLTRTFGEKSQLAVAYLEFADPGSCISAYDHKRLTPLIGFVPLPLDGIALLDSIASIDKNGPRLVENYRKAFPDDADDLEKFDAAIGFPETSAPGWLFAACSLALGLNEAEAAEARVPSEEILGLDTFVIEDEGRYCFDSRRLIRSIMSYRIAGASNVVLARSVFASLGHFVADSVSRLLRDWRAEAIICAGDLFADNLILLESVRGELCHIGLPIVDPHEIERPPEAGSALESVPVTLGTRRDRPAITEKPVYATERRALRIEGLVQGVGFRPFVARLARELGLTGFVGNDPTQVFIEVEGDVSALSEFTHRLSDDAPPLALLESIHSTAIPLEGSETFNIAPSHEAHGAITVVGADVAICDDCLEEMNDPGDRRFGHPFITCTNCGPRFTIVKGLPYDRVNTTMAEFPMCEKCQEEYEDPTNRRYHAQPIGCNDCGPTLSWHRTDSATDSTLDSKGNLSSSSSVIDYARRALQLGEIVAIKGIGGYHLACDATSDRAVAALRLRKGRADKPFAVMVANLDQARELAEISPDEASLLESAAGPIVLARTRSDSPLSHLVAPGSPLVGIFLPNSPVHHLLFSAGVPNRAKLLEQSGSKEFSATKAMRPLVMTSGNHSGEPICFKDSDVPSRIEPLVDAVVANNRPIHLPCDDSVVRVVANQVMPIRRSRGYAPLPVRLNATGPNVLAVGAELKNTFCVASGARAWVSQHIGDLENLETLEAFESSIAQFCQLYEITPDIVATDAHPGYLSSSWARRNFSERVVEVYHHHAHVASVMAEHRLDPRQKVIGVVFDGTGFGTDGTIWGGEILVADGADFSRAYHLAASPLPGGDEAVRNPCRAALAQLWAAGTEWRGDLPPVAELGNRERRMLQRQLETGFGCTLSSSMGRLYDAVSSILGIRQHISYEAQAAIELEAVAAEIPKAQARHYSFRIEGDSVDPQPVIRALVEDMRRKIPVGSIAAGFHLAVSEVIIEIAERVRKSTGLATIALSGGVFQNSLLVEQALEGLSQRGFDVLLPKLVPPNDGGLSLGQAFVALSRSQLQNQQP